MDVIFSQLTQPAIQDEDPSQSQAVSRCGWGQLKGFGKTSRLLLTEANREYVVGRHSSCNLVLSNAQVSNKHFTIIRLDQEQHPCYHQQHQEGGKEGAGAKVATTAPAAVTTPSKPGTNHPHGRPAPLSPPTAPASAASAASAVTKLLDRHPSADKALVLLTDTSSNGTYINGKLIGKGKQAALKHKDMISLATKNAHTASPDLCMTPDHQSVLFLGGSRLHFPSLFGLVFIYEDFSEGQVSPEDDEEMKAVNERYHMTEVVLGMGNFATVKLAFHPTTGEKFAVKMINKQKFIQKPKFHEHLVTEITILKKLSHVRVSFAGCFVSFLSFSPSPTPDLERPFVARNCEDL